MWSKNCLNHIVPSYTFEGFISEIRQENAEIKAELEKMNDKVASMEKMMKEI